MSYNPLFLLISILGQTLFFIYLISFYMDSIWFSISIVLIYIGGVLIIFLYLNSISSKMIINQKIFLVYFFFFFVLFLMMKSSFYTMGEFSLIFLFYSLKEYYFIWFIIFLLIFIFLINNLLLSMKNPSNKTL